MITLPKLPYSLSAFEPDISEKTMTFHYTKHHATYLNNVNQLIADTPLSDKSLNTIILTAAANNIYTNLFNNAAQVFNHNFFWQSITPAFQQPTPFMQGLIKQNFQNLEHFQSEFLAKGLSHFASGWLWLIATSDKHLQITTTPNANTPLIQPEQTPLLCLDLWEHAYYLDYQNRRTDYLNALILNHLNWTFAEQNFIQKFPKTD